ncbi:MAG TPA: thioredoxin family protein [Phycisphaerae bacterium]|nr:thioredoxin family protein [Phycisphaerae bacterium]
MIRHSRPLLLLTALFFSAGTLLRSARAADASAWTEEYAAAVKEAQKDHKMLLLDFTGSDWCPACIELAKQVFRSTQFAKWAGKTFVLVEVDFPNQKPQTAAVRKQNKALAAKFKVDAFPMIVILDSHEKELIRSVGYNGSTPDDWIKARDVEIAKAQSK